MYRRFRWVQVLFRAIVYQKHPGKQIIMSLTCLLVGGLACYFAAVGIVIGDYQYRWPALAIIGLIVAILGFITLFEGIVNAFVRGWDGRRARANTKPQPVEPKPRKYVPPKQHNSAAQAKSSRAAQKKRARRASQGKQKSQAVQSK